MLLKLKPKRTKKTDTIREQGLKKQVEARSNNKNPTSGGPFNKGERLIITNNYLELRVIQGIVEYSNKKYTVIIDDNNTPHKRIHGNFRRLT